MAFEKLNIITTADSTVGDYKIINYNTNIITSCSALLKLLVHCTKGQEHSNIFKNNNII